MRAALWEPREPLVTMVGYLAAARAGAPLIMAILVAEASRQELPIPLGAAGLVMTMAVALEAIQAG